MQKPPYACDPSKSRGRLHPEQESATRSVFQRDRDRIIHSGAFRRLKHKTQVFVAHYGDYYRTRLTHSLEVAQIARSLARTLELDEDLAEALALAHDLGHPPFGHAGEDALKASMEGFGGFDHNAQTIFVLTALEARYAEFDGLNLTWEALEGVAKHNGPLMDAGGRGLRGELPEMLRTYNTRHDLELDTFASAEAQIAAISDDIAYTNHDIDDGLRARLFPLAALREVPLVSNAVAAVEARYPGLEEKRLVHESIRRLITLWIEDVTQETRARIQRLAPKSPDDIRRSGAAIVDFSKGMRESVAELRAFLFANMYRHYEVNRSMTKAKRIVRELFALFLADPASLPTEWSRKCGGRETAITARVVCNYIAGMTDRFAIQEHRRLFDLSAGL
ncbi:MAG: deoxyguanosinetriphosphate triphosphohydrolase [Alphaproteobacteria bacterium]